MKKVEDLTETVAPAAVDFDFRSYFNPKGKHELDIHFSFLDDERNVSEVVSSFDSGSEGSEISDITAVTDISENMLTTSFSSDEWAEATLKASSYDLGIPFVEEKHVSFSESIEVFDISESTKFADETSIPAEADAEDNFDDSFKSFESLDSDDALASFNSFMQEIELSDMALNAGRCSTLKLPQGWRHGLYESSEMCPISTPPIITPISPPISTPIRTPFSPPSSIENYSSGCSDDYYAAINRTWIDAVELEDLIECQEKLPSRSKFFFNEMLSKVQSVFKFLPV